VLLYTLGYTVRMTRFTKTHSILLEKIDMLRQATIDPTTSRSYEQWLQMELTYTSNALEGNTLSRRETQLVVEDNISVGGKSFFEILEAKNHDAALTFVRELAVKKTINQLDAQDILDIHSRILKGIRDEDAGTYRNVPVRISGSLVVLPNHLKVDTLMDALISHLNAFEGDVLAAIDRAIDAHYQLVTIHPFVDGNGRVGRLLFNLILLQQKLPMVFIKTEERKEYLSALEKAQLGGSADDYYALMYKAVERSLDIYLEGQRSEISTEAVLYKSGEIAKLTGEDVATIRYWTKLGLLEQFSQTTSGYGLYAQQTVNTVYTIRRLQNEKRLTLEEIKDVLRR
jgi:Fic family protein